MSITADGLNQQGRAESSDKLYSIHVCVILFNTFSLSAHHYNKLKPNVKTLDGKKRLLNVKSDYLQF